MARNGAEHRLRLTVALCLLAVSCTGGGGSTAKQVAVPEVTGPAAAVAPAPHRVGVKWDWGRVNSFGPYLRQIAGGATFFELVWCEVQPERGSPMEWQASDDVAAGAAKLGFTLAFKIRTGSCWGTADQGGARSGARGKTGSAYPADEAAYDAFVAAAVARYASRGVDIWALENEVNARNFWGGTPEEYERLALRSAAVIRTANPKAVVADFGLSSTAWGTAIAADLLQQGRGGDAVAAWTSWFSRRQRADFPPVSSEKELTEALAGEQPARNLAMFAVVQRLAAKDVVDITQVHFYEAPENVPLLVDLLDRRFAQERVEAWEVGRFERDAAAAPADRALEASDATKSVVALLAGGVDRVIWLPAAVNPEGRNADEPRAGLMDPDGKVRPAGSALAALAGVTALDVQILPFPARARLRGAVFDGPGKPTVVVAWTSDGTVPLPTTGVTIRPFPPGGSGGGSADIGTSPVMLEVAGGREAALALAAP